MEEVESGVCCCCCGSLPTLFGVPNPIFWYSFCPFTPCPFWHPFMAGGEVTRPTPTPCGDTIVSRCFCCVLLVVGTGDDAEKVTEASGGRLAAVVKPSQMSSRTGPDEARRKIWAASSLVQPSRESSLTCKLIGR